MTLISILIGLGLEYFTGSLDHLRDFRWFDNYLRWIELKCSRFSYWQGPTGVVITVAPPLIVLYLVAHVLGEINVVLAVVLSIATFIYCISSDLNSQINAYMDALEQGDNEKVQEYGAQLKTDIPEGHQGGNEIFSSILLRSHDQIFGVIFWFVILGMVGALMYALVVRMKDKYGNYHGDHASAVKNLYEILIWPTTRLLAAGFALGGSLVDALDGWRNVNGDTLSCSRDIVIAAGLGAVQYSQEGMDDESANELEWTGEIQALVNRTLIVWLAVVGILTIGGYI